MILCNYANSLVLLQRFAEARSLLRRMIPAARRVFGENHEITLKMRWLCASALYKDGGATLDDLREAVETLEPLEKSYNRVFGKAHPETPRIQAALEEAREALAAAPPAAGSAEEKS